VQYNDRAELDKLVSPFDALTISTVIK
jgi:hypothetical protein